MNASGFLPRPRFLAMPPSPPLAGLVERYWIHEGATPPHAFERVLPLGREEIIINLMDGELRCYEEDGRPNGRTSGPIVSGLHLGAYTIDTRQQAAVMGVHLRPGGLWRLFGIPAHELRDSRTAMESILGRESGDLMDRLFLAATPDRRLRLLDAALLARHLRELHPAVSWAAAQISRHSAHASVAALADESGLSPRRFGELFQREIGLSPKAFVRLRRFRQALRHAHSSPDPDWCDLAGRLGFADQAHLIREFRAFSGLTPTAYHARRGLRPHLVDAGLAKAVA